MNDLCCKRCIQEKHTCTKLMQYAIQKRSRTINVVTQIHDY